MKKGIKTIFLCIAIILSLVILCRYCLNVIHNSNNIGLNSDTVSDMVIDGIDVSDLFGDVSGDYSDIFTDTSTDVDGSSDISTDTDNSSDVVGEGYVDADGCGYQTVDNSTVFFRRTVVDEGCISDPSLESVYICYSLTATKSYESFPLIVKWSYDGVSWNDFTQYTQPYVRNLVDLNSVGDFIYVSYTFVEYCENPMSVLSDLKTNVFESRDENNLFDMFAVFFTYFSASGQILPEEG